MRSATRRALLALVLVAGIHASAASAAGSWVADSLTPTLRQRGWRYESALLKPRASTPLAGKAITSVSWRYGFERVGGPASQVALCAGRRCIDAGQPAGRSTAFAGLAPNTPFRFLFLLAGDGMLRPPRVGAPLQLVVNFE